jgi:hypothetical protein
MNTSFLRAVGCLQSLTDLQTLRIRVVVRLGLLVVQVPVTLLDVRSLFPISRMAIAAPA